MDEEVKVFTKVNEKKGISTKYYLKFGWLLEKLEEYDFKKGILLGSISYKNSELKIEMQEGKNKIIRNISLDHEEKPIKDFLYVVTNEKTKIEHITCYKKGKDGLFHKFREPNNTVEMPKYSMDLIATFFEKKDELKDSKGRRKLGMKKGK